MPIQQDETAPQTEAQRLYAENLELRELLHAVATELGRMAAHEVDARNRRALQARAMRIRSRAHYGRDEELGR